MDIDLNNIAVDLYGKLQTRFPTIEIGDEAGEVLEKEEDIPNARFFEFPYKHEGVVLGTFTIKLDEKKGIVLQIGGDLVNHKSPDIFQFIRSLSRFASKGLLKFKIVNLEKSNLDKRDYQFQAKTKEEPTMDLSQLVMEGKMYGTKTISYQDLGEARIVIKHSQPINPEVAAGRAMHVERIYVENAMGERFAYPYKHLNGARAMAEHLIHGGNPYDSIGKYIVGLSEELSCLRKFKGHVSRNSGLAEAMGDIQSKVVDRIDQVKEQVQHLQRTSYYEAFAESFEESEEQIIPEDMMNDWVDRLTIRSFNEDLKSAFPYIFKLVSEGDIPVRELSADDILAQEDQLDEVNPHHYDSDVDYYAALKAPAKPRHHGRSSPGVNMDDEDYFRELFRKQRLAKAKAERDADHDRLATGTNETIESQFESFINSIVEGEDDQNGVNTLFSKNPTVRQAAVDQLNTLLATEFKGGPNGENFVSLKGIIDEPELWDELDALDPDLDARALIQQYIRTRDESLVGQLKFGSGELGGEEPEPEAELPAPAPAPEPAPAEPEPAEPEATPLPAAPAPAPAVPPQPLAEGFGKLKAKLIKAMECGADMNTELDFGHKSMTLRDAMIECGMDPTQMEMGAEPHISGEEEIENTMSGFWNREANNFTVGGTKAKQKVVKAFKDGEYQNATADDVRNALEKIEQMDPSTDVEGGEEAHTDHRPGVMLAKIGEMTPMESVTFGQGQSLARIVQLSRYK